MKHQALITALLCTLFLSACEEKQGPSSDLVQRRAQEALSAQSNSTVGMPAIVNFAEKRMMKDILEKRDQTIPTITYITDLNGNLHKRCDSVGYGLPYATQYTNPLRMAYGSDGGLNGVVTLPQSDPNGLFSPAVAEATWVMCKDPNSDKVAAVYFEDRVTVSPFPLK